MKTSPTRHALGLLALLCFLLPTLQGQVIWSEDFETNGEGPRYLSPHLFFDPTSNDDYWGRIEGELMLYADPASPGSSIALVGTGTPNNQLGEYSGYHGGFYFAGEDLDDVGGQGNPDGQDEKELLVTGIDISNQSDLWFKGLFAAGAMTGCGASTYDSDDYIMVYYSVDGGPYVLGLCFNADLYCNNPGATNNQPLHLDPDCDGDGGEGMMLVNAFQEFSFPVPNGSILNLKLVVHADDNGEEMAFDFLRIESVAGPTCVDPVISGVEKSGDSCQPGDPVTLTVNGVLNDADDWYWYAGGCGQPAAGTGASITVNPVQTTTYYVRGEPGCDGPLPCAAITVNVGTDATPPLISCPANQEVAGDANCSAVLADYTGQAVVEDDCDPQPTVSQSPASGTAFANLLTVTLTAEDGSGNTNTCTFDVQVIDNEAPSLTIPADVTLECDEPITPPAVTCGPLVILKPGLVISLPASGAVSLNAADFDAGSVDACGSGGLTFSFSPNSGNTSKVYNCNNTGTLPVTIWVTDDEGNQRSATSSIIVQDPESYCANGGSGCQTVPVLHAALRVHLQPDGEVSLNAEDWNAGSKNTCQSGNLTFSFSSNTNDQTRVFDCTQTGNQSVEVWVTDGSGNQARATATLIVQDQAAYCGAPYANCRARALLLDGLIVNLGPQRTATISASLLDAGSSDDCGADTLTFAFDGLIHSPTKIYTCDDLGLQIEQIRVIDGNGAFELLEVAITVMDRESSCEGVGFATASDNCDPAPALTWSDQSAPGECPVVEVITRTWTATDDTGNSASATQLITIQDTTPPEVVCPDDQTETLGPDCAFAVPGYTGLISAGDNCSLNLSVSQTPAAGAVLNASTTIVIDVSDDCENTSSCTFQLTLNDEIDPVVECPANQEILPTGNCVYILEDYTSLAIASDNCEAEPALNQLPATGTALSGATTVSLIATDAAGNSSACTFEVILISLPPEFNLLPSDITVSCESEVPGKQDLDAFDDCDGEIQVFFSQAGLPLNCPGMGTVVNTWTATDSHGNSVVHVQTVTILDQEGPEFDFLPQAITVSCAAEVPGSQNLTATDNCGGPVAVVYSQSDLPSCPGLGAVVNTWTATDCAGNSSVHTQWATIFNDTPPVLSALPQNLTVACEEDIPGAQGITATDNCGGGLTVVFTQTGLPLNYPTPGQVVNTWTVTDCAGNSTSHSQFITIEDPEAPNALCQNATIQISLNGQAILTPSMIDGGSSDNCGIASWSLDQTTFSCDEIGVYPVELTVADLFENEASCSALVNVVASFDCPAPGISYLGGPNISDPCSCLGNGLFEEEVVVGPTGSGQVWTVVATALLDPNTMQPYPAGTVLTEYDLGGGESIYALMGVHLDGVGYDIEVASPSFPGLSLTLSNVCYYPDPQIIGLDGSFCIYSDPVTLEGDVNGVALVSEGFTIDGTPASVFDPFDLGVGTYEVVYTVDAGTAAPGNPLDPGCVALATQFIQVLQTPASLACNNLVAVAVDGDCEALITPDMILEGTHLCYDDYSVTVKKGVNTLPNPVPGSYIGQTLAATVKHLPSGNSCTGLLILEDNLPPSFDCSASPVQINCSYDLSAVPPPVATDNCTAVTVQMIDELFVDTDPCGDNTAVLHRTWVAVDNYGNESAPCLQVIEIIRPSDIDFPNDIVWDCTQYAEFSGITAAASLHPVVLGLQSGITPIDASGIAGPAVLGNTGSGIPEGLQGSFCDYSYTYTDQVLNDCGNTFTIVRTWTVIDGCTGQIITGNASGEDNVQIISIVDQTPTQIVRPPFEATAAIPGVHPLPCTSEGYLLPATVTDDCSSWTVRIFTPVGEAVYLNGQNGSEGGFIPAPGLPIGVHTIVYQATDACNNVQELLVAVTVVDDISPVAICDEITTVTLSSNGKAVVPAGVFDDGSYDNCCMDYFEVRRMEDACGIPGNTSFGPSVTFCCEDIGPDPVTVVFRVYDCFGNFNECMVQVVVEDKLPPIPVFCPPNQTITCEYYQDQLAAGLAQGDNSVLDPFGIPLFFDNCGLEVTQTVTTNLNTCTEGTINRQWTAVDPFGNTPANCTQVIQVEHVSNWVVEFPADITATCDDASLPPFGEPEIFFDDCELAGTSFSDQEFTVANGSCYMIVRTWTVINWCLYDDYGYNAFAELSEAQTNLDFDGDGDKDSRTFKDGVNNGSEPDGYIVYNQTITVVDKEAPIFQVSDLDICILETACNTNVTLLVPFVEDCSDEITVSVTTNLPNGSSFGPYLNVPPGIYTATYAVSDGCNNTAYQEIEIVVEDCLNPTPLCDNGLVVEIMQSGMISIEAEAFDEGSWDNCGGPLKFSFSSDVNDVTRFYTCDDLGEQAVDIWVTDTNGNQDFCTTILQVQDNMNFCTTIQTVNVAGAIQVENGNPVSNVMVDVNSGLTSMTTSFSGMFNFELPSGNDYTITPTLNLFPANGVTTLDMILIRKHILGVIPLNSPYKIIAADANKSGAVTTVDLIAIQKIILVLLPNFPNNTSWRFVDMDYVFLNPQNPWQTGSFPEVISYNDLSTDQLFTDFVAVKVGDVNLSAHTGSLLEEGQARELAGTLEFVADEQELTCGETFILALRVKPAEILGYQFTLDFDKEAIEWLGLAPGLVPEDYFGWALADEGAITTNWYAAESTRLDEETVLFQLTGRAGKDGRLSDWLRISSRFTPAEAYNAAGEQLEVRLLFEGALQQSDGFALHQNWPNPFRHSTRIGFELPEAGNARLTILDASGKILEVVEGSYPKGYNEIQLGQLRASGILYYKLETPTHVAVRKMVALE